MLLNLISNKIKFRAYRELHYFEGFLQGVYDTSLCRMFIIIIIEDWDSGGRSHSKWVEECVHSKKQKNTDLVVIHG
ncbi:MAG TPA: hypothetical protein VKA87_01145 [Nitrososphaeraceae archaeon]|nr:hypothetical protein [Nitrososphaeraceae archaeon]